MKLAEALSDFLYDKKYFVSLFDNCVHVYRYLELLKITPLEIDLKMTDFVLKIYGNDLLITKMNKDEVLINGQIISIGKIYE